MVEIHITEDDPSLNLTGNTFESKIQSLSALSEHVRKEYAHPIIVEHDTSTTVTFGVPAVLSEDGVPLGVDIPNSPFVFLVNELYARDPKHPDPVKLENVPVIMAHGYRDEKNVWRFADDQNIALTVNAYNRWALKNGFPEIEFVISCNQDNTPNPAKLKISDLDSSSLAVQAVGDVMSFGLGSGLTSSVNGHIVARMTTMGEFFGLDRLKAHKELIKEVKIQ